MSVTRNDPTRPAGDAAYRIPDLERLFAPRSIAIIGASTSPETISGRPQRILAQHGYPGAVYPVNPRYRDIDGRPCYPDIAAVPGPVDVALVVVAARRVPQVLAACAAAGVRFAVVISSGFAEQADAANLQRQLEEVLAAHPSPRVIGPNSEGLIDVGGRVPLGFSPTIDYKRGLDRLIPGEVAVVAQSGGLGFALFNDGQSRGLGFSDVVSTGNEADLDLLDVAAYLLEQQHVQVVLLFVEGLPRAHRLHTVAARARRLGKPLVVAKVGRSAAARRAALSHTAHLAGHDAAYDAVLRHYGAARAEDQEEMVDLALAFARCPLPHGRRTGVVTPSGGAGTWMADALETAGLSVPTLSAALRDRLRALIPAYGSATNPVDVTAQIVATAGGLAPVLRLLAHSGEVDAIVLVGTLADHEQLDRERAQLAELIRTSRVPLLFYTYTRPTPEAIDLLADLGIPFYTSSTRTARALAALHTYTAAPAADTPAERGPIPAEPLEPFFSPARHVLTEPETKNVLRRFGLPVPDGLVVRTPGQVEAAAGRLAGPVAVKAVLTDVRHKTDIGALALDLATPEAAASAAERVIQAIAIRAPAATHEGFLVETMASPGVEMILGARVDPDLGPLVLVGHGGVDAETWHDTALAPAPLTRAHADHLIRGLRAAPLLAGTRGRRAADIPALVDCLVRLSHLIAAHRTDIADLDCNPVLVHEDGQGCTVVDAAAVLRTSV
ncbi:MAG: acetate--CoA ligase family protein [Streptosporangiaceae bacterium]